MRGTALIHRKGTPRGTLDAQPSDLGGTLRGTEGNDSSGEGERRGVCTVGTPPASRPWLADALVAPIVAVTIAANLVTLAVVVLAALDPVPLAPVLPLVVGGAR